MNLLPKGQGCALQAGEAHRETKMSSFERTSHGPEQSTVFSNAKVPFCDVTVGSSALRMSGPHRSGVL